MAVIAIPAVFAFVGLKRGFAKVVLGLISTVAAFACAMALSGPIADAIYKNKVEKPVEEQIAGSVVSSYSKFTLERLSIMDFDKVKINGIEVGEIELDYAGTRKTVVDLSKLDLGDTNVDIEYLRLLSIADDVDPTKLNAKTAEFSMDDIERYGLGKLAVAQYVAVNLIQQKIMVEFDRLAEKVSRYLPGFSSSASSDSRGVSALRTIAVKMLDTGDNFKDAAMNGIIKPNCTLFIRSVVFGVIFLLVNLALRIAAAAAKLVNKMPVIGKVNSLLGFILGFVEGIIVVFVVCLAIRFLVSVTDANSILFNQTAIDSTFLFKWIYDFEFLNFIK